LSRPALSERALIILLASLTAVGPVALNIYLPVLPLMCADFGVSVAAAGMTVSLPLVAFAAGLLLCGPLSDHYGRRPVILGGFAIYIAGSAVACLAPTLGWLTLGRVIQALGTATGLTIARAVIGDRFPREKMARMIAYLTMVMATANSLAPVAGGALGELLGWRAVFALLLAAGLVILLSAWRWLPETRVHAEDRDPRQVLGASKALLAQPLFLGYALQCGIVSALFLVFISLMPHVFIHALGHTPTEYGCWYLTIAIGYVAGNWHVTRLAARIGIRRLLSIGIAIQALGACAAWLCIMAGWWQPAWLFLPWALIAFGQGLALPNATASAVALAPAFAGAAAGLLGFGQQLMAALSVQAMAATPTATPLPLASFVAAGSLLALVAWRFGPRPIAAAEV
jgi:MFS transporter, DHA1 family, multidrug resistance protein